MMDLYRLRRKMQPFIVASFMAFVREGNERLDLYTKTFVRLVDSQLSPAESLI